MTAKIVKYNSDIILPKIDLDNQFCELKVNDDYEILYNDKVEIKLGYGLIYDKEYDLVINYNNEYVIDFIVKFTGTGNNHYKWMLLVRFLLKE